MPLLLNNRDVTAAMQAGECIEAMEEAFRELGAMRAGISSGPVACSQKVAQG